ncbi:hypothetical protein ACFX2A_028655 [Malus domestica]
MVRFSNHNLASFNCFYWLLASWNLVLFDKIGDSQFIDFEFSFNYMNPHPPSLMARNALLSSATPTHPPSISSATCTTHRTPIF